MATTHAPKCQDRSQGDFETRAMRQRCVETGKSILKLKEKDTATFNSPSDVWCLPAPSCSKPEGRAFVVDSGSSMHVLSRKDLNSVELETIRVSRNFTTVITANGEVQTNKEVTVYVYDLDLFLTVQILEGRPAVLSLGKLCEDHGYSHEWTSGQKPTSYHKRQNVRCYTEKHVPIVVPRISTGPPSLTSSTSSTSVPQDSTTHDSTPSPATTRSRSTHSRARGDFLVA